jgi:hypothetical protein
MKHIHNFMAFILLFSALSCKKDSAIKTDLKDPAITKPVDNKTHGKIVINFNNKAGNDDLILNTATYQNSYGESFTVSKFKYYISNIILKKADGSTYVQRESYHLIDNSTSNKHSITLDSIPLGNYTSINFLLGVDSARNTSGAQIGALDPANGMFWSWNQGYIFLMMEGNSPNSTASNNSLIFHLGGFTPPYNCIRSINPTFGQNELIVSKEKVSKMEINADLKKMFDGKSKIKFSQTSVGMDGGVPYTIANNCVDMFSVISIVN